MTDRTPLSRTAISNGGSTTSANSRPPMDTGARLRPAREAEYPAKCLSVATIPADSRPCTYAVPMVPTRSGSSPMVSSTRPQRASRTTSRTGAHADRTKVAADRRGHPPDQVRVERGAPRERNRVRGGAPRGESGQALLVGQRRNAEPVGGHDAALGAGEGEGTERGIDWRGAERPRQLAEPMGEQLVEVDRLLHVVLVRGDVAALRRGAHPYAEESGDLLLERHLGEQRVGTGLGGAIRVAPNRRTSRGGLFGRYGQVLGHFPPTPISPWTRARRANR